MEEGETLVWMTAWPSFKVFEACATSSGNNATLSVTVSYLIRSVFDGYPGTSGQSRGVGKA